MSKTKTKSKNKNAKSELKTKLSTFKSWKPQISVPFLPEDYPKNAERYAKEGLKNPNRDLMFEEILRMKQQKVKAFCLKTLRDYGYKPISENGFLYAKGDIPVMLVAHMDTVHQETPKEIIYKDTYITSPQGIGGDDRCGVFMILEIARELNCHILFTEDEECGCVGAKLFTKSEIAKKLYGELNYIIEMDRRGEKDAVFYYGGNKDFVKFIEKNSIFKEEFGSYSDICEIAPELDASAVNISSGYFNEHTKSEYIDMKIVWKNINEIKKLITTKVDDRFEWQDVDWRRWGFSDSHYDDYGKYLYEVFYDEYTKHDYVEADSDAEAVGKFFIEHPELTYQDICVCLIDEYDDYDEKYYKWF